jgi:hypothetical protein
MDASATDTVCLANIGPRERAKRLGFGVTSFALSVALAAWLVASGAPSLTRLVLVLPLLMSGLGFFQWQQRT